MPKMDGKDKEGVTEWKFEKSGVESTIPIPCKPTVQTQFLGASA